MAGAVAAGATVAVPLDTVGRGVDVGPAVAVALGVAAGVKTRVGVGIWVISAVGVG
jgi:hypothetical protein